MSLTPADLRAPIGEIERSFFTETVDLLDARLDAYLSEGYDKAAVSALPTSEEQDWAAREWAYYRAKRAMWLIRTNAATTASIEGELSASWTSAQLAELKGEWERHLATFHVLVPDEGPAPVAVAVLPHGPTSTAHYFTW